MQMRFHLGEDKKVTRLANTPASRVWAKLKKVMES
jgi:hypothetical protein